MLDIAKPSLAFGFGDTVGDVVTDLDQSAKLTEVDDEDGASDELL
ncbi:hypothetical protein [Streptomyces lasiicapitis]